MTNDVLRLKNDVLNELRNKKYYAQDELRLIVDDSSMSQKQKVEAVIGVSEELFMLDSKIAAVESIFVQAAPAPQESAPEQAPVDDGEPTNIVEPAPESEPVLNQQGQTHSE
jgi:hypothetical protein